MHPGPAHVWTQVRQPTHSHTRGATEIRTVAHPVLDLALMGHGDPPRSRDAENDVLSYPDSGRGGQPRHAGRKSDAQGKLCHIGEKSDPCQLSARTYHIRSLHGTLVPAPSICRNAVTSASRVGTVEMRRLDLAARIHTRAPAAGAR
jgi:hypothetical protein